MKGPSQGSGFQIGVPFLGKGLKLGFEGWFRVCNQDTLSG